ncbi:MAG: thiamine-phosphate diphosphorylase [Acidobacteria bacterium 13_1_20CM_3_53_8]|nr:MAG: thiamine-phosphate diphosphorylase [Acidobacteria bacterium 13_1_20CM_3_53_8]
MSRFKLPKLYTITDARLSGLSHAEQVKRLTAGGSTLIQLREKILSPKDFYASAKAALRVAHERGARLIINDRVDIALALHADGVHLGQTDLPPEAARKILGHKAIIGFSTHNLDEARLAAALPVDYIAIGPIFATSTKEKPDPLVGLEGLRKVREAVGSIPLVAIGGISRETAPAALAAGADAVAVISLLLTEPATITDNTRKLLSSL